MAIREVVRGDRRILVIDIVYRKANGEQDRYRRDAQVQTKTAAKAEHDRLVKELVLTGEIRTTAPAPAPQQRTFGDAVSYYEDYVKPTLKHSTSAGYDDLLDGPYLKALGSRAIEEVDEQCVAELNARLKKAGNGSSSRRNHQIVVRTVLRSAVQAGYLPAMPKLPKLPKLGKKELVIPSVSEVTKVIEAAKPHQRVALALAMFAGLRAGEIRGLRRMDVDLDGNTITVRQAICRGVADTPKSGHERVVPIAPALRPYLVEALSKGDANDRESLVAKHRHGEGWSESGIGSALRRAQQRAGVRGWTLHTLRHHFVTSLLRNGAGAHVVQKLAGHHSLAVTQRYAHADADDLRKAIDTLVGGNGVETKIRAVS
jgi:integrase